MQNFPEQSDIIITDENTNDDIFNWHVVIPFSKISEHNKEFEFDEILDGFIGFRGDEIDYKSLVVENLSIELNIDGTIYLNNDNIQITIKNWHGARKLFEEIRLNYHSNDYVDPTRPGKNITVYF